MDKKLFKKSIVISIVIFFIAAFRILNLGQYLTLPQIKAYQHGLSALYAGHPFSVIAGYMLVYILFSSLSLPGAEVMSIAGGAVFGLWMGTIIVSFASTLGGTAACIISRFLLRDWVQSKLGDRALKINQEVEREGAFYLFTLRLIPVFPFFMTNLAMGLTKMPLMTFLWVSQLGMLPATIVFVNAGSVLAEADSIDDILSARLLLSFALLGLFPLIARKLLSIYKSRGRRTQP